MVQQRRTGIADSIRQRVVRGVETGALVPGERLPGTRELAAEFGADPRVVAAACRLLAAEGLVEIRPRSGLYVAAPQEPGDVVPAHRREWLAETLWAGVTRGIAVEALQELLERLTTSRVPVAVIATTIDQTMGMARELRADYAVDAYPVLAERVAPRHALPRGVTRARLLVTTDAHAAWVGRLAARRGVPHIVASIRPDILGSEWLSLLRSPVYVVAADHRFLRLVRDRLLQGVPGAENVRLLRADRAELSRIPDDARVYVTQAARAQLGRAVIPGRHIPPERFFGDDCVREILRMIVTLALGGASVARAPER